MELVCPQCENKFASPEQWVYSCPSCLAQYSIDWSKNRRCAPSGPRLVIDQPVHVACEEHPRGLTIWWNWRTWDEWIRLLLWLIWFGFYGMLGFLLLFMAYAGGFASAVLTGGAILFLLLGLVFTLWFGYHTLAGLINTTTIELTGDELRVRYGPIPGFAGVKLPASRIRQLSCEIQLEALPPPHLLPVTRRPFDTYDLVALLHDDTKVTLIARQSEPNAIRFAEQQLERRLDIQDGRMRGEYTY